jgi:hypothetical protein
MSARDLRARDLTARGFTAELIDQPDPEIGREVIRISFDDGHVEDLHLHDYERLYSLPGVYEEIVTERLGCRSPWEIASMLAAAVDSIGRDRAAVRALDIAAGNGISGEALAGEGLRPVVGTDIVPEARVAALRDRPAVYERYLTLDLLALRHAQRIELKGLRLDVLSCVAPVGNGHGQVPAPVLVEGATLLGPDALIAYMYDPQFGVPDAVTAELWTRGLGEHVVAQELARRRYVHRRTVNGLAFEMEGVVWRVRSR